MFKKFFKKNEIVEPMKNTEDIVTGVNHSDYFIMRACDLMAVPKGEFDELQMFDESYLLNGAPIVLGYINRLTGDFHIALSVERKSKTIYSPALTSTFKKDEVEDIVSYLETATWF